MSDIALRTRQIGLECYQRLFDLQSQSSDDGENLVAHVLDDTLQQLAATGLTGPSNQQPSIPFWDAAGPMLRLGSLQRHAREKPSGYPGDFELLDRICRNDVTGNSIGLAMDVYFQRQSAPQAVRNRSRVIAQMICRLVQSRNGQPVHFTSIGSGPAWDVRLAVQELSATDRQLLRISLLDVDPYALEFCEAKLRTHLHTSQLQTHRVNLARGERLQRTLKQVPAGDLIACAGFFDYLDNVAAVNMLQLLWNQVADQGSLMVFNFALDNPSRPYMEWVGNWYLHYRTANQLEQLSTLANLPDCQSSVDSEAEGINLFLRCDHDRSA